MYYQFRALLASMYIATRLLAAMMGELCVLFSLLSGASSASTSTSTSTINLLIVLVIFDFDPYIF